MTGFLNEGVEKVPKAMEVKVTLVTGGNSGIGRATALVFVTRGGRLVIADLAKKSVSEDLTFQHS